jgi:hypothetical protein
MASADSAYFDLFHGIDRDVPLLREGKMPRKQLRRRAAAVCIGAGVVVLATPFMGVAATTTGTGSSAVSVGLPSVTVSLPTGAVESVALGTVKAESTSVASLLSSLTVAGTSVLGHAAPGQTFSTASGAKSGSYDVPVPSGLPVTASLNLANYGLSAASGSASTVLSALTGKLGVTPLNLTTDLGQHGISTQVTPTGSSGGLSVVTPPVALKLSDILPTSLLNGLPLGLDLSIIKQLNLPLGTLGPVVTQLNNLLTLVKSLDTNLTNLSAAQAQFAALETGALQTAQATVNTALALVSQTQSTVTSDLAAATANQSKVSADGVALTAANQALSVAQTAEQAACLIPGPACTAAQAVLSAAQTTVNTDQAALSSDQAALAAAQSAVASAQQALVTAQQQLATAQTALNGLVAAAGTAVQQAQALVNTLTSTVNGLLSQVQTLLNQLSSTNVDNLLKTLTAAIGKQSLFDLGPITTTLSSTANAAAGTASVTCLTSSLTVLGVSVPVPNCAAVSQALSSLGAKLDAILKLLPVSTPKLTVSGLTTSSQATPSPVNGATSAGAAISALTVDLPQMKLSGLVDQLTQSLKTQLQQLLSTLGSATPAVHLRPQALSLVGVTLPSSLTTLVSTLLTEVNALPTGQALQGLSTVGLHATTASVTSTASFATASSPVKAGPIPTATPPGVVPPSGVVSNPPKLPSTGTNAVGTMAAGLLLLVAGYYLLVISEFGRRPRIPAVRTTGSALP